MTLQEVFDALQPVARSLEEATEPPAITARVLLRQLLDQLETAALNEQARLDRERLAGG